MPVRHTHYAMIAGRALTGHGTTAPKTKQKITKTA